MAAREDEAALQRVLQGWLGELDDPSMALLRRHLEWVSLPGGSMLMRQGEVGDALYLTVSGRLRAYVRGPDGRDIAVREMGRGDVIGEMSLYTDEPRSASVAAVRDSRLVRLGKAAFHELLALSVPASVALTRQVIRRLQDPRPGPARPVVVALLPVSAGVDVAALAAAVAAQLAPVLSVAVVDSVRMQAALDAAGAIAAGGTEAAATEHPTRVAHELDAIEAAHALTLLVADPTPTAWTRCCLRHCDELLRVADAGAAPQPHANDEALPAQGGGRAEAAETLVLLHPADRHTPSGTRAWLARRPVAAHLHVRPALPRDVARLARLISGRAVGLVLAGGGARGLAHLGVWQALRERDIEVDVVGGTSIGAIMAAAIAADQDADTTLRIAREAFQANPTGDFNVVPLLSLIAGVRLRQLVRRALRALFGRDEVDVEDLWKPFYCIASNYSRGREERLRRGPLATALLASSAIPGALPPVAHDGDLLCDGGSFANFPVDAMREMRGVGRVIGVDLSFPNPRRINFAELPGPWTLLRDRLRPRRRRRYRVPSLAAYLMNVTILYSQSRREDAQRQVDLYLNPPLPRVGMLQWQKFDRIVAQGRAHADAALAALAPEALARLQGGATR